MNPFTSAVFDVLERFIVSPWNLLKVECGWRGVDPLNLDPPMLDTLLPKLRAHVARMTDDDNATEVAVALQELLSPPERKQMIEYDV